MDLVLHCCCRSYATRVLTPSRVGSSVVGATCGYDPAGREYSHGHPLLFVMVIGQRLCVALVGFVVLAVA